MKKIKIKIIIPIVLVLVVIISFVVFNGNDKSDTNYYLTTQEVDNFSPDVYLTLYNNKEKVSFKKIEYLDGVLVANSIDDYVAAVNKNDISLDEVLVVTLENGKKIEVKVRK